VYWCVAASVCCIGVLQHQPDHVSGAQEQQRMMEEIDDGKQEEEEEH
jgi:hypothetical protein